NKKPSLLDQAYLRWSLIQYGAPLSSDQEFNHKPDINELLIETLKHGRTTAELNAILPSFIYKNFKRFNWDLIMTKTEESQYLGYLLSLTDHIKCEPLIKELFAKL